MAASPPLTLSAVSPDFQSLVAQLQQALSSQNLAPAWADLLPTSTGTHLIDFISAVGAMDQYAIERAVQELYLPTAELASSIYAIITSLGVRIARSTPASATFSITYTNQTQPEVIPAYTQFSAGGVYFFNPEPILFSDPSTPTQLVTLLQGEIITGTYSGSGEPFQVFVSPEANFEVADTYVQVSIDGASIPVETDGLWNYSSKPGVQDFTSAAGNLVLLFGNSLFGSQPSINSQIEISYVDTQGAAANSASFTGTGISSAAYPQLVGNATTGISGGGNQLAASLYATIGPNLYAANNRAVIPADYNAIARTYAGVVDAYIAGPRVYAPNDVRYMNASRASILTSSPWTSTDYQTFFNWFQTKYAMSNTVFFNYPPTPVPINITADIYASSSVIDQNQLQISVENSLTTLLSPQPNLPIINMSMYLFTLSQNIGEIEGVDYAQLTAPLNDIYVTLSDPTNYFLIATSSGGGGTLAGGTYMYAFTPVTSQGEGLPISTNYLTTASSGGTNITTLSWRDQYLTQSFNVYRAFLTPNSSGGSLGNFYLIGSVASQGQNSVVGSMLTFVDDGLTAGTQQPPLVDQSGVWYVAPGTITINVFSRSSKVTYVNPSGQLT